MAAPVTQVEHPRALRTIVLALGLGAVAVFVPMWAPLVLAAWVAHLCRPALHRWAPKLGRRRRAAAGLVLLILLAILTPLALIGVSLVSSSIGLVQRVLQSQGGSEALRALVSTDEASFDLRGLLSSPGKLLDLARQYGARAWSTIDAVASLTAQVVVGVFVFLFGAYSMLADGETGLVWARRHAPVRGAHVDRLVAAFHETGRGLFIGMGLTGLLQATLATIAYLALGVPSAVVLGGLTFFGSLIPSIGTVLVWVPVALGLALSGRTGAAIVMVAIGLGVIGVVDNIVRPVFARYGKLELPGFVVLVSMFGALALFGAWGLLLGPLVVRLFVEALHIAREEHLTGP